ncbi:MAG: nucleotidyltransferase domain-containing protein [Candidatus Wallbacteria bacterium]|nr:nucleotidyltransferase domain-containing protein [Candidatus Wallbacteria bacterium]
MDRIPSESAFAELRAYIEAVRKRFGPLRAVLFGSRARGTNLVSSDYDVLLVSERFRGMPFRERLVEASRDWDGDYRLDVLCYTADELERKRGEIGIVAEALRQGMEIEGP